MFFDMVGSMVALIMVMIILGIPNKQHMKDVTEYFRHFHEFDYQFGDAPFMKRLWITIRTMIEVLAIVVVSHVFVEIWSFSFEEFKNPQTEVYKWFIHIALLYYMFRFIYHARNKLEELKEKQGVEQ